MLDFTSNFVSVPHCGILTRPLSESSQTVVIFYVRSKFLEPAPPPPMSMHFFVGSITGLVWVYTQRHTLVSKSHFRPHFSLFHIIHDADASTDVTICHSICFNIVFAEEDNLLLWDLWMDGLLHYRLNINEYILESIRKTDGGYL